MVFKFAKNAAELIGRCGMGKPKLKEHLYREMVNELRHLVFSEYERIMPRKLADYGRARTDIVTIVSKYIEAGE
jgi:hypothetical protein